MEDGTFKGTAAIEIKQELGLEIPEEQLINLTELAMPEKKMKELGEATLRAIFLSAGGCDEYIQIFLHEVKVPRAQLEEWTGKLTGLRKEGETVSNFTYSRAPLF